MRTDGKKKKGMKTSQFASYLVRNFGFLSYQLDPLSIIHSFYEPNYDGFNQTENSILYLSFKSENQEVSLGCVV